MNQEIQSLEQKVKETIDYEKLYELGDHLRDVINEIFTSCGLYFRIFLRIKTPESVSRKIVHGKYGTEENPKHIQDLIGLRVVLYYYDDLRICRDIMESTFQMHDGWSMTNYNADEFKAAKINGVFTIPEEYFKLYKRELWEFPIDTTFEIQFRTMFFEGWHEIEHDMRYKSLLTDEQFWAGSEELSRMLNCILANLELSDWSLVRLFDQLSYNHYKNENWELMIKSKFRIKMDDTEKLHPNIVSLFNANHELAKSFFKCTRISLIRELLKLDNPHVTYNLIIKLLNNRTVHNEELNQIFKNMGPLLTSKPYQKTTLSRLDSGILFHLEIPLLHKETRKLSSEFNNGASIIYKWIRYKLNPVFTDIPVEICEYENHLPGYDLKIIYRPENMTFSAKLHYIDSKLPGTLWHAEAAIMPLENNELHFCHITSRDAPHGIAQTISFLKPSYLNDLSSKVGLIDQVRLGNQAHFLENDMDFTSFSDFIQSEQRILPIVAIVQCKKMPSPEVMAEDVKAEYLEGYDMNTFIINGMRLAKVTGLYSHVYMLDSSLAPKFAETFQVSVQNAYGCIAIFWPTSLQKPMDFFTQETVRNAQFDFNRFAFYDDNISEKAFRHKLVQLIKDDNISR